MDIAKKREKDKVIENHKKNFVAAKDRFAQEIKTCKQDFDKVLNDIKSPEKLRSGVDDLMKLEVKFAQVNPLKDDLQKKGNSLVKEDDTVILEVQNDITGLLSDWENLNDQLKQEIDTYCNLQQALTSFGVIKNETGNMLNDFERSLSEIKSPNDLTEAYITKEKYNELSKSISNSKNYLDKMDSSSKNILKLSRSVPQFDIETIENEMKTTVKKWNDISAKVRDQLSTIDAEIALWQQIEESKSYLLPWLKETVEDANNQLKNLVDVNVAQAKWKSYKEQLSVNEKLKDGIQKRREQLVELNENKPIPNLDSLVSVLDDGFGELDQVLKQLGDLVSTCESKENILKDDLKGAVSEMNSIREKLMKCDDLTGDIAPICERLTICREKKKDLDKIQPKLDKMDKICAEIVKVNPGYANSSVTKELNAFKKRYADTSSYLVKIENTLILFVNKSFKDKLTNLKDTVDMCNNKIAWCLPEDNFDLEHLESKLTCIKELEKELDAVKGVKQDIESMMKPLDGIQCPEITEEVSCYFYTNFIKNSEHFFNKSNVLIFRYFLSVTKYSQIWILFRLKPTT